MTINKLFQLLPHKFPRQAKAIRKKVRSLPDEIHSAHEISSGFRASEPSLEYNPANFTKKVHKQQAA